MRSKDEDSCLGAPAIRVVHPARVQIVECIRRSGRPLSAADLADSFGERCVAPRIEHHLHRLRRLGIVAPAGGGKQGSALHRTYRLAEDD